MVSLSHVENYKNKDIPEPYVGPRPFGLNKEDQERFFGRDDETEEIISLIYSHQLVLIYGESGTGKTSIFNGQVIPSLGRQGFEVFPNTRIGIGSTNNNPIESFDNATKEISNVSNIYIFNAIQSILSKLPSRKNADGSIDGDNKSLDILTISLSTFLKEYYPPKTNSRQKHSPQLLIFDQFEELFTFYPENWQKQQQEFFLQITEALNNNRHLRVVLIIREDYIAQLDPFKDILPEKLRPCYRLERLSENAAISAIKEPLEKVIAASEIKEYYDEIHEIIEDLLKMRVETFGKNGRRTVEIKGSFIEPIYLQVVCQRWWRERIANKTNQSKINKNLHDFADVGKALQDFYEDAVHEATKQTNVSEDKIREFCEKKLITPNGTRGIVYQEEKITEGLPNKVIEILDHKYLIRREIRSGGIWYELIHDRLIKPIKDSNRAQRYEREKDQEKILAEAQAKIKRWHHNLKIIIPIIIAFIISGSLIIIFHFGWLQPAQSIIDICAKYPGNVSIGKSPFNLAINPNTNTLYIPNGGNSTVSVINCNGPSGKTTPSVNFINVGKNPSVDNISEGIAVNPNTNMVYVTNHKDNTTSVIDGSTDKVVKTIPVGHYPIGVAVNPKTNMVYVTNHKDNTTSVIDGSTDKEVKTIPVGHYPNSIAVNPKTNMVYVANKVDNTASMINGSTDKVVKTIPVSNPNSIAVNPNINRIYVGNSVDSKISVIYGGTNNVMKNSTNNVMEIVIGNQIHKPVNWLAVNPKTNMVYVTIKDNPNISMINGITNDRLKMISAGNDPEGIAVNPNTNMVYVTNFVNNTVFMVNPSTKNNPNEITVGNDPDGVDVNPYTNIVYVANRNDNTISVINGSTNNVVKNPSVDTIPEGIAVNPNTNMVYVTDLQSNTTSVIDGSTNNVVKDLIVGHLPIGVAVNPYTNMVYVTNSKSNTTSVIDGSTDKVVKTITVGHYPNRIAVNPYTNMVYVTNSKSNTTSVIDGSTDKVVKTITVGHYPIGVAVNPKTNMVYVTNFKSNTTSVIDGSTNNVVKNIIVGKNPNSIAVNPKTNMVYVTNYNDKTVSLINEHNNVIIDKNDNISKIKTIYPNGIAVNPKTNMVYIIDQGSNILLTIKAK